VGGGASVIKVQGVCAEGNVEACEKVKFTEAGGFAGGIVGGGLTGLYLSGPTAGVICAALGVPTGGAGTFACGLVLIGVSSLAAGEIGGKTGEFIGDRIYEVVK